MVKIDDVLSELVSLEAWGYHAGQPTGSEPAALAALALLAHGARSAARRPIAWLNEHLHDGSTGVFATQDSPGWPTTLALLAWTMADDQLYAPQISRGLDWLLQMRGIPMPQAPEMGHNTLLIGWPWVEGTHSWVEPTALAALALKATGHDRHPRTREAVRLLIDRLLADGGCNYGNTMVLGQTLRAHIEPSGIALAALAGEADRDGRIERTIRYLETTLDSATTTASLSYALLGLGAHNRLPKQAPQWLEAAATRTFSRDRSPFKLALLALAAKAGERPLHVAQRGVHAA